MGLHFNLGMFKQALLFTAPILLPAFGVPGAVVNLGIHAILTAEQASQGEPKSGAEKKAIALEIVRTGLEGVNAAKPGTVNVGEVMAAVDGGIDATIAGIKAAKNVPTHTVNSAPALAAAVVASGT